MGFINRNQGGESTNYVKLIVKNDPKKGPVVTHKNEAGEIERVDGVAGQIVSVSFITRTIKRDNEPDKQFDTIEVGVRDNSDLYIVSIGGSPLSDEVLSRLLDTPTEVLENEEIFLEFSSKVRKDGDKWVPVKTKKGSLISTARIYYYTEKEGEKKRVYLNEALFDDRKFSNAPVYDHLKKDEYLKHLDMTKENRVSTILNNFMRKVFAEYAESVLGWKPRSIDTDYQTGVRYQKPYDNDSGETDNDGPVDEGGDYSGDQGDDEDELPFD